MESDGVLKKFSYWACIVSVAGSVLGMIVCIASAVVPETYHPLWTLCAILFGCMAVAMAQLANIERVGYVGWQQKAIHIPLHQNIRGKRADIVIIDTPEEIKIEEETTVNIEVEVETDDEGTHDVEKHS